MSTYQIRRHSVQSSGALYRVLYLHVIFHLSMHNDPSSEAYIKFRKILLIKSTSLMSDRRSMSTAYTLMFILLYRDTYVVTLSLCNTACNYLEVKEGSDDNIFTCTGLTAQETVSWVWNTGGQDQLISQCPPPPSPCSDSFYPTLFRASRTSDTASLFTVYARQISDPNYFGTTTLTCQASSKFVCQLDSVYPAENSRCQVQFNGNTWKITASCSISKFRSARNNSRCFLYQVLEASQATSVGSYPMDVTPASSGYFSGTCNMTSYLPPEGRYSYHVIIMPGEVNVSATFNGNNTISPPNVKPSHNCLPYYKEGDNISCLCFVSDPGNPSGILWWNNRSSNHLEFKTLQKLQNGIQSVCSLTWNNTVKQSVSHTLIVAYRPSLVSFLINNNSENVSVVENSTVAMKCQADGRPTPLMTIAKVSDNSILKTTPEGNITVDDQRGEIIYTVATAQCSDSDKYRCTAANSLGMKDQSVNLIVKCKPRIVLKDSNSSVPAIIKGESYSFYLIASPAPTNLTKYYLGPNLTSNEQAASDEIFRADCTPSSTHIYKFICTVTVMIVTSETTDYYKLCVSNDLGNVDFIFQALPQNITDEADTTSATSKEDEFLAGAIAGAVVGGLVVIGLVIIAVIFFLRQKGKESSNKHGRSEAIKKTKQNEKDVVLTTNVIYESNDNQALAQGERVCSPDHGPVLSMSPMTESAYENAAFAGDSEKGKYKGKGAREARRRNDQGLLYTTVLFSNAPTSLEAANPRSEPTEYATIRQASAQ